MKALLLASVATAALLGSTTTPANDSMSLNQFPHRVEPVLVQVNAQGKVTGASPAYRLTPKLSRLLHTNLSEMIRKPATNKHGNPIPSQFIMNVALQSKPLASGDYAVHFDYVSTTPVPPGSWYWVHLDGDRLALASQDASHRGHLRAEHYNSTYNWMYPPRQEPPTPAPTIQNTQSATIKAFAPPIQSPPPSVQLPPPPIRMR